MSNQPDDPSLTPAASPEETTPIRRLPLFVQRQSPVNTTLIVGSVLLTLWTALGEDRLKLLPWFVSLYPPDSAAALLEVRHGQIWRLVTPIFLHFGAAHLGFNMLNMFSLGTVLERRVGSRDYLGLTLAVAVGSDLAQYFVGGSFGFGGMSGVVYALFGYTWLRSLVDRTFGLQIPTQGVVIALVWFVLCFTGTVGDIANTAHAAGLILGALWGVVDGRAAMRRATRETGQFRPPQGPSRTA